MKLSQLPFIPAFFDRYLERIPEDIDLIDAFKVYGAKEIFDRSALESLGDTVYAPGKWTAKETIQHCIDTERILAYRALCIARGEKQSLPGFEENDYAREAPTTARSIRELLEEYYCVQQSNVYLFSSLNENLLARSGTANGVAINVAAIGFAIIGHGLHHKKIVEERYMPLVR